jgi:hypothetical protein
MSPLLVNFALLPAVLFTRQSFTRLSFLPASLFGGMAGFGGVAGAVTLFGTAEFRFI